ncbi:YjbE family integral membrane protein [Virgibacillus litoralis]|uniref:YjbE family integral membrane protein n=1 Tax=Virgibacillus litoralis TaxID=578221 RepID=A0ABS4HBA5_9BACI|nr:TerC family protein [Virgibacillus litoralis]MBP1948171.1 YjbE family integral membrane protein [Virgibacillus litoralis]
MLGIEFTSESIIALFKIIAIDIVLSGDNAIVIAMATKGLPKHQQNKAIFIGTGGAVFLRILFAILIVYLLQIPYVHSIGGALLLWIAYHVLVDDEPEANIKLSGTMMKAVGTIIVADAVMSLDNVVAVAGAAHGHIGMIALGVAISIPIMIFGSKLIVRVLEKHPWIAYIGAGILAWTAGEMITGDAFVSNLFNLHHGALMYAIMAGLTIATLLTGYLKNNKVA